MLIHTGQHYDENMSKVFFRDLRIPDPDIFLGVGSGSHAEITAKIMIEFEKVCLNNNPRLVIVAGDVNSTLACALAAKKLNIPIAHVESGLRSYDQEMPEEINRMLTDRMSDLLFVTEESGIKHSLNEGIARQKIHFVGNCMIDSVKKFLPAALEQKPWHKYALAEHDYTLITLHRPSNVDSAENINKVVRMLNEMSKSSKLVFPVHPRTKSRLAQSSHKLDGNILMLEPLPYLEFLGLMAKAKLVVTDSGGIQEETTYLGVQCITFRENTERPVTVDLGTNQLVGTDSRELLKTFNKIINGEIKKGIIPPKWDGNAGTRIVKIINEYLAK
jgi:UDP-N-acetylglucosamine 2-epimerase (non-hydrolysing)